MKLKDPVDLKTTLTVETTPNSLQSPDIYWDGEVNFHDATLTTGVVLEHVTGTAACQGRYKGQQLEGLVGHLVLDQTTLFNQPFSDIHAELEIAKEFPKIRYLSDSEYAGATSDTAQQKAQSLATRFRGQVDGIFCVNESSAYGTLRALEGAGMLSGRPFFW